MLPSSMVTHLASPGALGSGRQGSGRRVDSRWALGNSKEGTSCPPPGAVFPLKEGLEACALPGRDSLPTVCSHTWAVAMETLEGLVPEEWGRGRAGHVWPLQVCSPWAVTRQCWGRLEASEAGEA